jgi:hypothetical protein
MEVDSDGEEGEEEGEEEEEDEKPVAPPKQVAPPMQLSKKQMKKLALQQNKPTVLNLHRLFLFLIIS